MLFPRSGRGKAAAAALLMLLAAGGWFLFHRPAAVKVSPALRAASEGLNDYEITLRLLPEEQALAISETVRFRNGTGETLDSLVLRLWLNAFQKEETSPAALDALYDACYPSGFSQGGVTLYDVRWNDAQMKYSLEGEDGTVLRIEIPSLPAGEEGTLFLRCVARIPSCAYRTGTVDGQYQLGNVIPLLSCYTDGAWRTDAYHPIGDPFLSECANFRLTLDVPQEYTPACSAYLTRGKNGLWQGELPAARDIALVLYKNPAVAMGSVGETKVYSYAAAEAEAKQALAYARKALQAFSDLYGNYPYPVYSVCSAAFPFSGMEYPALSMIGREYYAKGQEDSLELIVAHETAHQWFYALVGSDQALSPWQDEALCEYAMLRYVRRQYGQSSYETLKYLRVEAAVMESVPGGLTPGTPISDFSDLDDYHAVVYDRGAALLLALDEFLPGGADGFLRAYVQRFSFHMASRADFDAFLNAYAGLDAGPLLLDYLDTKMD
ncbi:MAG: M1 family metallopeptidase [Clostridia bacterium]|nr:M1 family metallopeptidase [Clostridia bacterium]